MKKLFTTLALGLALGITARAADVTLSNVHLCCGSCVKGVDKAVADVSGLSAKSDQDAGTVVLAAADTATLQKGVDALTSAGYFGTSSDPAIKVNASTGAIADLRTTITASTGTLNETTATLRAAGPAITDLDGLIRSFAATAPDVQRAVKGIADTSQQTAAIGTNLNATTHDLQVALHPILNPEPCATRGCKIKRALSAAKAAGPGAEGIYYLIEVGKLIF